MRGCARSAGITTRLLFCLIAISNTRQESNDHSANYAHGDKKCRDSREDFFRAKHGLFSKHLLILLVQLAPQSKQHAKNQSTKSDDKATEHPMRRKLFLAGLAQPIKD